MPQVPSKLAVLTSGGDSAGMNAAVRAVVRAGLASGVEVFGVYEGLRGLVRGGDHIRSMSSADVGAILQEGGTVLGTARSQEFVTRDGRRQAAANLVERDVDALVVIGGDGSLTGANEFRKEWPELLDELVSQGSLDRARAEAHRQLSLVGLVGSIDNDMFGTDMTIGADTALHRIVEAVDAIQSTASSHQRTFVIEVMGRNCGYLALMASLATGANFVLIPERPPGEDWETSMCRVLRGGRDIGRRANIVLVAEGARDLRGEAITADHVKLVLAESLGEDARVTILGHVQRGGSPSAFDRYLGTALGYAAVRHLLESPDDEPRVLGIRGHRVASSPLVEAVEATRSVASHIANRDFDTAMQMRGGNFTNSHALLQTMTQAHPREPAPGARGLRIAVLHAGGVAPGMNTAVRVAVRIGMDRGHRLLGVTHGFKGLADGDVEELGWMSVSGWVSQPGANLGTSRHVPDPGDIAHIAEQLAAQRIDGLLVIGGWEGYAAARAIVEHLATFPALSIPIVCVPASVNNDLPASDMSIGADTALNSVMNDVDKIKQSMVGPHRCFVVEVAGRDCGFLPLMGGLATGAEQVYIPEEGMSLDRLRDDIAMLRSGFAQGKRRGLILQGEHADELFTSAVLRALLEHESQGVFDVRTAVLGPVQHGGRPSPFDRLQATRLVSAAIDHLAREAENDAPQSAMVGLREGKVTVTPLQSFDELVEPDARRPRAPQWWIALRDVAEVMSSSDPAVEGRDR